MPDPLGGFAYTWPFYAAAVFGYLLGSIPFGLVLTRLAGLGDIRKVGSGNIGATNVLRTGRKGLAAATLLLDGGKGALAVLAAGAFGPDMAVLAGGGALVGHCFPIWLRFKGGKGVATYLGVMLAIAWPVGLASCVTWLAVAALLRWSSVAALAAAGLGPLYAYYWADWQRMELAAFLAAIVFVRHHANIRRLLRGEEPKIGRGGKT
jgi:glycerol-3-phosphate acyltransferase PlsY